MLWVTLAVSIERDFRVDKTIIWLEEWSDIYRDCNDSYFIWKVFFCNLGVAAHLIALIAIGSDFFFVIVDIDIFQEPVQTVKLRLDKREAIFFVISFIIKLVVASAEDFDFFFATKQRDGYVVATV